MQLTRNVNNPPTIQVVQTAFLLACSFMASPRPNTPFGLCAGLLATDHFFGTAAFPPSPPRGARHHDMDIFLHGWRPPRDFLLLPGGLIQFMVVLDHRFFPNSVGKRPRCSFLSSYHVGFYTFPELCINVSLIFGLTNVLLIWR
ncbi:hypothetical protein FRB95_004437 [Tulasnella sp. JGI-2019a]|nr:hypothetical protein FRB95_004437 [Tulasnella sp. JGI-2019a]